MKSDEPGFANPMPGTAPVTHAYSNTQGSTGSMRPASDELGQVLTGADPFASAQSERPTAAVGYQSTQADSNPLRDPVSATVSPTDWSGNVITPHHPNAGS